MGLFDIFKKSEPVTVNDEFFGSLRLKRIKNDSSKSYFEGKGTFSPTGQEIEYFINGDETGLESEQKEFYKAVQENFSLIVENIKPLIEDEFRNWQ